MCNNSAKDSVNFSSNALYRKCHVNVYIYAICIHKQHKQHIAYFHIDPAVWTPLSVSLSVSTGARIAGPKFQLNVIILVIIKHMSHYLQMRAGLS